MSTPTRILFDETHNENTKIQDTGPEGLSTFANILNEKGFEIKTISDTLLKHLDTAHMLWIAFPSMRFTGEEVVGIKEFVENGGGLLLIGEWGNLYDNADILNKLSKEFGITFNADRVTDAAHAFTKNVEFMGEVIDKKKVPQFVKISNFRKHPVTEGIKQIVYFAGCSLDAPPKKILAWSNPTSFGDLDADRELDVGELKGTLAVACGTIYEKGKVVCIGDSSLVGNKYLSHGDNKKFMLNVCRWLSTPIDIVGGEEKYEGPGEPKADVKTSAPKKKKKKAKKVAKKKIKKK